MMESKRRKLDNGKFDFSLQSLKTLTNLRQTHKELVQKLSKIEKKLYIKHIIDSDDYYCVELNFVDHVPYITYFFDHPLFCYLDKITQYHIFVSLDFENICYEKQMSLEHFKIIVDRIMGHIEKCKITSGENVGIIAAQSLSEKFTQSTLNTFHLAGIKSSCVGGIEQINAILSAVQKQQYPKITNLYSKHGSELVQRRFCDICSESAIRYDKGLISLEFHVSDQKDIKRIQYWNAIRYEYTVQHDNIIHIQSSTFTLKNIKRIYYEIYEKRIIIGIPNSKAYDEELGILLFHPGTCISSIPMVPISEICYDADLDKITCNDLQLMQQVYGIECTREYMLKEMDRILSIQGIHIDQRHIKLIIDNMTCTGAVLPNTYVGVSAGSVILKASFERATRTFAGASSSGTTDYLKDTSSQIMMGKLPFVGTGTVHVINNHPVEQPNDVHEDEVISMYSPKYEDEVSEEGEDDHQWKLNDYDHRIIDPCVDI